MFLKQHRTRIARLISFYNGSRRSRVFRSRILRHESRRIRVNRATAGMKRGAGMRRGRRVRRALICTNSITHEYPAGMNIFATTTLQITPVLTSARLRGTRMKSGSIAGRSRRPRWGCGLRSAACTRLASTIYLYRAAEREIATRS